MTLTPHLAEGLDDLVIPDRIDDLRARVLEDQLAELRAQLASESAKRQMLEAEVRRRAKRRARELRHHKRDVAVLEQALERAQGPGWWRRMVEVLSMSVPLPS